TDNDLQNFSEAARQMSDVALRQLAVPSKPADPDTGREDMHDKLLLLGPGVTMEPARGEVKPSVTVAKEAGIITGMNTCDQRNTPLAIAKDLDIATESGQVITGPELENITAEELNNRVAHYSVFARVSPEQKVRIVHALKAKGNTVSMTGDGVNDAP